MEVFGIFEIVIRRSDRMRFSAKTGAGAGGNCVDTGEAPQISKSMISMVYYSLMSGLSEVVISISYLRLTYLSDRGKICQKSKW